MNDVTPQITAHLMDAVTLSVEVSGNRPGKYAVIAQATVDSDGKIFLEWERYGPDEEAR